MDREQTIKIYNLYIGKEIPYGYNSILYKITKLNKNKYTIYHETGGYVFLGYKNFPKNTK